jgi:hypothetical protein
MFKPLGVKLKQKMHIRRVKRVFFSPRDREKEKQG